MRHRYIWPIRILSIAVFTVTTLTGQTATSPTGQIKGFIQTADGKPVVQARVAVLAQPQAGATYTPFRALVLTASDGTFSISAVPDGVYTICPRVPNSALVPPCVWGSAPKVTVSGGKTVTASAIQLQAGADFYLRVNDLVGTLLATIGKTPGAAVIFAIRNPSGVLTPIPQTAQDIAGFDYHLPVPFATSLVFVAHSGYYTLSDGAGAAIPVGATYGSPINIPLTQAQYKQVINVH